MKNFIRISMFCCITPIIAVDIQDFMTHARNLITAECAWGDWHPGYDATQDIYITIRYTVTHPSILKNQDDRLTLIKYKRGNDLHVGEFEYKAILVYKGKHQEATSIQHPEIIELFEDAYNNCPNLIT